MSEQTAEKQYWLVTHEGIDTDNACAMYLLHKALGLNVNREDRRKMIFVPPGNLCEQEPPENVSVLHLDTGKTFDPERGIFDHHFKDCEFYSATHAIAEHFWGADLPDVYCGIVEMANFRDTAGRVGGLDYETLETLARINTELRRIKTPVKMMCVPLRNWPQEFSRRIHNLDRAMSNFQKMLWAMNLLEAFVNENAIDPNLKIYVDRVCETRQFNGLNTLVAPRSVAGSGQLRHYVRKHHLFGKSRIDVIIAEYSYPNASPYDIYDNKRRYAFSIMLPDEHSMVRGMNKLKAMIEKEQTQNGSVYLHEESGNILHVSQPTNLKLEDIVDFAQKCLHTSK